MREHHFEVIVAFDDGEPSLPYLNQENSAYWSQGTVYDTEHDWQPASKHWEDDLEAGHLLQVVLDFPTLVAAAYRRNTDGDGWDIVILEEVAELLKAFGIDLDSEPAGTTTTLTKETP